jgi:hypothetical protein
MLTQVLWAGALIAAALALGCADEPGSKPLFGGSEVAEWPGANECVEPRMEVCTREYRPVCGRDARNDARKTYSNKCEACADPSITEWRPGTCAELAQPPRPRPRVEP